MNNFLLARQYILGLETVVELKQTGIDFNDISKYISTQQFEIYQKSKGDLGRYYIDLLTSDIYDSNQSLAGTDLSELDFKTPSEHLKNLPKLQRFLNRFECGRTHIIKLNRGGCFPPHRDGPNILGGTRECFRILITLDNCEEDTLNVVMDNKVIKLKNNSVYYINTYLKHSAFAFKDDSNFIIANVAISMDNVESLIGYITK